MTKHLEHLGLDEYGPKSPTEVFKDIVGKLEPFLEGEQKTSLRNTSIVPTEKGDMRFTVFIPSEDSPYSPSVTCQIVGEKSGPEGKYTAPISEIHLKLRHLDKSLAPSSIENINTAYQKLYELELALAVYKAAKLPEIDPSIRQSSHFLAKILKIAGRSSES